MSLTNTGVITGAAITGFTTPTYTLSADTAPNGNTLSAYVSVIGGTQTGVLAHSYSTPFTRSVTRPSSFRSFASAVLNGVTGQYSKVPYNEFKTLTRKAAAYATNQYAVNEKRETLRLYANTETFDLPNVKALLSFSSGYSVQDINNYVTLVTTGSL